MLVTTIHNIAPQDIGGVWKSIAPWVESALGNDKSYTVEDVKRACASGGINLWLIYRGELKGFFTAAMIDAPQGKTCYAPWLGGKDLGEWVGPAFAEFKKVLRAQGCISFSWIGRKAWKRFLGADYEGCFYLMNL